MANGNGKTSLADQAWLTVLARGMSVLGVPMASLIGYLVWQTVTETRTEVQSQGTTLANIQIHQAQDEQILADTKAAADKATSDQSGQFHALWARLGAIFDNVGAIDARLGMRPPPMNSGGSP